MKTYRIYDVLQMIEEDKSLMFTDNIYDVFYDKELKEVIKNGKWYLKD